MSQSSIGKILEGNPDWHNDFDEDDDNEEGEIKLFVILIAKSSTLPNSSQLDPWRSTRYKKTKILGDEWITTTIKEKVMKVERSTREVEPTLVMTKKLAAKSKNQKYRTMDGIIVEIQDDTLGTTLSCKDYGGTSSEELKQH